MSFLSQPRQRRPLHPSQRKWTRGEHPIASAIELEKLLEAGFYIFVLNRSAGYHPSFIRGWQFGYVMQRIKAGKLFPGVRNLSFPFVFDAVWHQATNGADPRLSRYFVACYELGNAPFRFESKSRSHIIKRCTAIVRSYAGESAKCVVKFDDSERP